MSFSALLLAMPLLTAQPDAGCTLPVVPNPPPTEGPHAQAATPVPSGSKLPAPARCAPDQTSSGASDLPQGVAQLEGDQAPLPREPNDTIIVQGRPRTASDPLEGVNARSFALVQSVDTAVTGPVALAYRDTVPRPVRSGLRNFLGNLTEPVVALNYLLQLKPGKSAETLGRFAVNSTIGVAGLFDVAKKRPFSLPRRPNGFGNTLGYYGVKSGAYLYLPFMGPTTVRDLVGRVLDISVLPVAIGQPFSDPLYVIPTTTVRLLDERAEADEQIKALRKDGDPYWNVRQHYLRERQAQIDALHRKRIRKDP
ncbi:MlaA family lipoprotein [Sphingomonas prati]|uniref:Phospholipid-binding lipoprotein MlaA n=1 Tax=Sphingomonas prati TaxID=1843237 RepID=A0A7W9BRZ3_9SPHN|nr:VacJ family lipoprotein [Sphingomonas prati]MBB5729059.1 phospholipid-binding lipoprotein MlaA [Sphingomonas prati]GGE85418.1 hypothetical protein GCM10011404_17740 [Sphingomonas prati]